MDILCKVFLENLVGWFFSIKTKNSSNAGDVTRFNKPKPVLVPKKRSSQFFAPWIWKVRMTHPTRLWKQWSIKLLGVIPNYCLLVSSVIFEKLIKPTGQKMWSETQKPEKKKTSEIVSGASFSAMSKTAGPAMPWTKGSLLQRKMAENLCLVTTSCSFNGSQYRWLSLDKTIPIAVDLCIELYQQKKTSGGWLSGRMGITIYPLEVYVHNFVFSKQTAGESFVADLSIY